MFRSRESYEQERPTRMRMEEEFAARKAAKEHEKRFAIVSFYYKKIK